MTAYSGTKIKLAPNAAVYDVVVERPQSGTQGIYTITLSGTFADGEKIVIDGTEITLDSTSSASVSAAASAVATAMNDNTKYTVAASSGVLTFTEKSGNYGIGMPSYSTTSTSGKLTAATTTEGVSTIASVKSPTTFVDRLGVLHAAKNLKAGDVIQIHATCTYINPSGDTSTYEDDISITVN